LSATAYSIDSQLPSTYGGHFLEVDEKTSAVAVKERKREREENKEENTWRQINMG
jgi:hypothetical protein